MNEATPTTVKVLREQLVNARQVRDLGLLRDVEEGLRQLGKIGYRCCLVDFDSCRLRYYVRLLGYEQARVKAQIEFPISPEVAPVQWLPLSHLADYAEAENAQSIRRIYEGMAHYIQHKSPTLQVGMLGLNRPRPRRQPSKRPQRRVRNRVWLYLGGLVVLAALASLIAWGGS